VSSYTKTIHGKVAFQNIEGGIWGVEADQKYHILDFPEQLKSHGAEISCVIRINEDMLSFASWGTPCFIVSFSTIKQ